jgi:hypothetical protein
MGYHLWIRFYIRSGTSRLPEVIRSGGNQHILFQIIEGDYGTPSGGKLQPIFLYS